MAFPYLLMDGMNEKGLSMSVLKLRGDPALQDTGKNKISTTVALRLVLDRAANVDEALELLDQYDMQSSMPDANFHFLLADASGKAVVLEYLPNGKRMVYDQNYVTNFYLTENVPYRGRDDEMMDDASDTVYRYFVCSICPVKAHSQSRRATNCATPGY